MDLPIDVIHRIKNYNYVGNDYSFVSDFYMNIAQNIIKYIPSFISPNIITLFGLSLVIISSLQLFFLNHYLGDFSYLLCAILLFFYQVSDILDGMQARKLNMYTNPTTEFFDHSCDAITASCCVLNGIFMFNINSPLIASLLFLSIATIFYVPTWEHCYTREMRFPTGIGNPSEALCIMQISYLIVYFFPFFRLQNNINYFLQIMLTIILVLHAIFYLYNSIKQVNFNIDNFQKNNKKNDIRENKYMSTCESKGSLFPLFLIYILAFYNWYFLPNNTNIFEYLFILITAWNFTIINLIWQEISHLPYNLKLVFTITFTYFIAGKIAIYSGIISYFYVFNLYVQSMCKYLFMPYFWSIPKNKVNTDFFIEINTKND